MQKLRQQDITYRSDSTRLHAAVAHQPWSVYLDSCAGGAEPGRYDVIVASPVRTLVTRGNLTTISTPESEQQSEACPFELVRHHLGSPLELRSEFPFIGGALGFFSYDLGRRLESIPSLAVDDLGLPEMAIGIYDWALIVDHLKRKSTLVSAQQYDSTREEWERIVEGFENPVSESPADAFRTRGSLHCNMSRTDYEQAFNRIQHYIMEGDCYQVNLSRRFQIDATGSPWSLYRRLRKINPAPYSAYMNYPFAQILSSSPERFMQLRSKVVETRPIKGTRPRSDNPQEDRLHKAELAQSEKDRAENLMIVDLLRNDLGKCCVPGSISVDRLFEVESYSSVHHLVSTIRGELREAEDGLSLLRCAFPGGSITGAPKLRAMEIIEELETHRRGVYCGSIGYISKDGGMDSNIAIRTFLYKDGSLRYSAGGGIVADSECAAEYQESYDKARVLFELLDLAIDSA